MAAYILLILDSFILCYFALKAFLGGFCNQLGFIFVGLFKGVGKVIYHTYFNNPVTISAQLNGSFADGILLIWQRCNTILEVINLVFF